MGTGAVWLVVTSYCLEGLDPVETIVLLYSLMVSVV